MKTTKNVDVAIIGAGTAGIRAMHEAKRAGRSFVLIDSGPLGTTCARVGCMPSKALLHAAKLWSSRQAMATFGAQGTDALTLDSAQAVQQVRALRDRFANGAAAETEKAAGEHLLRGRARFVAPNRLSVALNAGGSVDVEAQRIVIATGSTPRWPASTDAIRALCDTTDTLFELPALPRRMAVLGTGAIGVEMSVALARLGVDVTLIGQGSTLANVRDPVLAPVVQARLGRELTLRLNTQANFALNASGDAVDVSTADGSFTVDRVLVATGRVPQLADLDLAAAGVSLNDKGLPTIDPNTRRIAGTDIFIAGDVDPDRGLLHEASDEGRIAGYNAAHQSAQAFERRTPSGIVFTDPDIVSVGMGFGALPPDTVIGQARGNDNGRSIILGEEDAMIRVYADAPTGRVLGAALMAPHGEHLGHLLAWAIQRGETLIDLLRLPFYHPVVEELLRAALQDAFKQLSESVRVSAGTLPVLRPSKP